MSRERTSRNDPCPCGSGKKYKHCCARRRQESAGKIEPPGPSPAKARRLAEMARRTIDEYPLGTLARYGPDDKTASKIVAAVFAHDGAEPVLERWVSTDIDTNEKIQREVMDFLKKHGARKVVAVPQILGCPHEEEKDFPLGEDCPFCPFWAGKQGTARRDA
jgi:hypothetical protein